MRAMDGESSQIIQNFLIADNQGCHQARKPPTQLVFTVHWDACTITFFYQQYQPVLATLQTGFLLFRLDASPLPDPSCPWNASRVRTRIGAGSPLAGDWRRQVNRKTETLTFNSQTCAQCFLIVPPPRVKSGGLRILSTVGHCLPRAPRPKWRITIGAKPQSQLHTHCCFFSIFFMAKKYKKTPQNCYIYLHPDPAGNFEW